MNSDFINILNICTYIFFLYSFFPLQIVEFILQAIKLHCKLLVCAPSNVAVDNILEKLVSPRTHGTVPKPRVVRLGHPARVNPMTQKYCLDALILHDDGTEIVRDVRKEMDTMLRTLSRTKDKSYRRSIQTELKSLRKEARQREEKVVSSILQSRDVVLSTLVGASSKFVKDIKFDIVVIDEAAQALEAACWIPMLRASKVVLAGDHCQLPPTVKNPAAEKAGLGKTLFERIITAGTPSSRGEASSATCGQNGEMGLHSVSRMLNIQYRMNQMICDWASTAMYNGCLVCADEVAEHTLCTLPGLSGEKLGDLGSPVMLLLDTTGCHMYEEVCRGGSYSNLSEAKIVANHVKHLIQNGVSPIDIGVVTPYNGQVEALRTLLSTEYPTLSIRTVDGFQGGEKEAIILSFVRSNEKREVGFLADRRRINVAVTRARRHVAVICDAETCSSDAFIRSLLDHISDRGDHRSAMEYCTDEGISSVGISGGGSRVLDDDEDKDISEVVAEDEVGKERSQENAVISNNQLIANKLSSADISKEKEDKSKPYQQSAFVKLRMKEAQEVDLIKEWLQGLISDTKIDHGYRVKIDAPLNASTALHLVIDKSVSAGTIRFPSSLSSYQRMKLHEYADQLYLSHNSIGDGSDRCMEINLRNNVNNNLNTNILKEPSSSLLVMKSQSREIHNLSIENTVNIELQQNLSEPNNINNLKSTSPMIDSSDLKTKNERMNDGKGKSHGKNDTKSKQNTHFSNPINNKVYVNPIRQQQMEARINKESNVLSSLSDIEDEDALLEAAIQSNNVRIKIIIIMIIIISFSILYNYYDELIILYSFIPS